MRAFFLLLTLLGCQNQSAKCVEGSSLACACSNGTPGAQVCSSSGTFEACECAAQPVVAQAAMIDASVADAALARDPMVHDYYPDGRRKHLAPGPGEQVVMLTGSRCVVQKAIFGPDKVIGVCSVHNSDIIARTVHATITLSTGTGWSSNGDTDKAIAPESSDELKVLWDKIDTGRSGGLRCACAITDWDGSAAR